MHDLSHLFTDKMRVSWIDENIEQRIYIIYVLILDWSFLEEIYRDEIDALFVKCLWKFTTP